MMTDFALGKRSRANLEGVDARLVMVVERAIQITGQDFSVIEGVRSVERQRELVDAGFSRTMDSNHLTGRAVDLMPWIVRQGIPVLMADIPLTAYRAVGHAMLRASQLVDVPIVWGATGEHGGDWRNFNDMPHFELPRVA